MTYLSMGDSNDTKDSEAVNDDTIITSQDKKKATTHVPCVNATEFESNQNSEEDR